MEDAKRFAIMSGSHRTWAVASIHGESEKLADLHQLIAEKYRIGDKLVYMGNILGVGSKVKDVITSYSIHYTKLYDCHLTLKS